MHRSISAQPQGTISSGSSLDELVRLVRPRSPSYSKWLGGRLLAQAKSAKRLVLNSRLCLLIERMILGVILADRAGSSRALRDARRGAFIIVYRRRRYVLVARSRQSPPGWGAGGRRAQCFHNWLATSKRFAALAQAPNKPLCRANAGAVRS